MNLGDCGIGQSTLSGTIDECARTIRLNGVLRSSILTDLLLDSRRYMWDNKPVRDDVEPAKRFSCSFANLDNVCEVGKHIVYPPTVMQRTLSPEDT